MIARLVVGFGIAFALCGGALAQTQAPWPCRDEIRKSDPNALFIRVSDIVLRTNLATTKSCLTFQVMERFDASDSRKATPTWLNVALMQRRNGATDRTSLTAKR